MDTNFLYQRKNAIALISALVAAVFGSALANGFVWDDWELIVSNQTYIDFNLRKILSTPANGLEYLPVKDLTLAADYFLWGEHPFGFHLTNLILYLSTMPILHGVAVRLARLAGERHEDRIAFWTTLLFALHPLHVEPVNFITARNTILAGLFVFSSLRLVLAWMEQGGKIRACGALFFFALALLSKAHSVFFPGALAVLFACIPARSGVKGKTMLFWFSFLVIDLIAVGAHLWIAYESSVVNEQMIQFGVKSWGMRAVGAFHILLFYLEKIVAPLSLSVSYASAAFRNAYSIRFLFAVLLVVAAVSAAWALRKKRPFLTFGIAWYLFSLAPVMNLIPTHPAVADRYAYFAVFGIVSVAAGSAASFDRKTAAAITASVLLFWMLLDVQRTLQWRDDVSLWTSAAAVDPETERTNLAHAYWKQGLYAEALEQLKIDRERSGDHRYYYYEGLLSLRRGDADAALVSFRQALAAGGDTHKDVHLAVAGVYESKGLDRTALFHYLRAENRTSVDPLGKHGEQARDGIRRMRERLDPLRKRLELVAQAEEGNVRAQTDAAILLHEFGLYDDAVGYYRRALALRPETWELWYNIGLARMEQKQWGEAIGVFQETLRRMPLQRDVMNNLAISLTSARRYDEARRVYESLLTAHPDFLYALINLGRLNFQTGDRDQALYYFRRARTISPGADPVQMTIRRYLAELER